MILGGSGYLRVTVSAAEVGVEFRRPSADTAGEVTADRYRLPDETPAP